MYIYATVREKYSDIFCIFFKRPTFKKVFVMESKTIESLQISEYGYFSVFIFEILFYYSKFFNPFNLLPLKIL